MELKSKLPLIWIRGAGDIATGVGVRLLNAGFQVIYSEIHEPTVIRRTVAFSSAVFSGLYTVEGFTGICCSSLEAVEEALLNKQVPIYIGDERVGISKFRPIAFVEGTIRKKCIAIPRDLVPFTVALGPGFSVPEDVDAVIETMRGHYLGQVIWRGAAIPNTGIPGEIGGYSHERVIHSPSTGRFFGLKKIGDYVTTDEPIALIKESDQSSETIVMATISGILRGLIVDGIQVEKGMKIADIDPRCNKEHCFSISDKARSVGGGVLEAILHYIQLNT